MENINYVLWFKDCSYKNKHLVGGKCSSLGELYYLSRDITFDIADGFAITTTLYDEFIHQNNLHEKIENKLVNLNTSNLDELETCSNELKELVSKGQLNEEQTNSIIKNYYELCDLFHVGRDELEVAIRSSAIAEDLPNASFAGQQDTYLNIKSSTSLEAANFITQASISTGSGEGSVNAQEGDIIKQIKDLKDLLDAGALTKEEFEKAKKKLLN